MKYILIGILLLLTMAILPAQQPAYFIIGEEELKNENIYSIHQGEDEIIYATTNTGLFAYIHGRFKRIKPAKEQIGGSLFGLERDSKGNLYCFNLSGQIFKVEHQKLQLVFTIPKEYLGTTIEWVFGDDNILMITSKFITTIDYKNWEIIGNYKDLNSGNYFAGILSDGTSISYDLWNIYKSKNGKIIKESVLEENGLDYLTGIVLINDYLVYGYSNRISNIVKRKVKGPKDNIDQVVLGQMKIEGNQNYIGEELMILGVRKGMDIYAQKSTGKIESETWFPETFLSHAELGTNGKILLGTFKKGIYVVPDRNNKTNGIIPEGTQCRNFCVNKDTVYYILENNLVYKFDGGHHLLYGLSQKDNIDYIFHVENVNLFNDDKLNQLVFSKKINTPFITQLKDVYQKKNGDLLIAKNNILSLFSTKKVNIKRWDIYKKKYKKILDSQGDNYYYSRPDFNRISKVSYDEQKDIIYIVNNGILESWDSLGQVNSVLYKNQTIKGTDLENDKNTIYVGTYDKGVLSIINGKTVHYYNKEDGLKSNHIRQLQILNRQLFVLHTAGLQIINMNTKKSISIGTKEGIDGKSILNFEVEGNKLWLNTGKNITSIDINQLDAGIDDFHIRLDSTTVNDKKIEASLNRFSYNQKNIAFHTSFSDVLLENETELWYRLEGVAGKWESRPIHDYLIQYKSLSPGDYTFRAFAQYRNQKSEEITYSFRIVPPLWQRWWFYPLIISITGFFIFRYFRNREKQLKEINQASLAQETAEREQVESELKALRSQMNPHFIFNSLNSIQDLILDEETDKSYDYIVRFAELVRNTLNYSNQKFIPMEKELDFLDVYLSLEKLRFDEEFSYEINYDGDTSIQVPSLIIQPFIENALLHGLLHKKKDKRLVINFAIKDELLTCTVTDNGVGRKRAKQIRERQRPEHQSFSIDAIGKRLNYLSEQFDIEAFYAYTDLMEGDKASGTQVFIQMPYQKLY